MQVLEVVMSLSDDLHSLHHDLECAAGAIKHLDREMLDLSEIRRVIRLAQHFIDAVQPLLSNESLHVEKQTTLVQNGEELVGTESWKVSVAASLEASQLADLLEVLSANVR
jgi:hypothetical protein